MLPSKKEKERKVGQIAPTLGISGYVGLVMMIMNVIAMTMTG